MVEVGENLWKSLSQLHTQSKLIRTVSDQIMTLSKHEDSTTTESLSTLICFWPHVILTQIFHLSADVDLVHRNTPNYGGFLCFSTLPSALCKRAFSLVSVFSTGIYLSPLFTILFFPITLWHSPLPFWIFSVLHGSTSLAIIYSLMIFCDYSKGCFCSRWSWYINPPRNRNCWLNENIGFYLPLSFPIITFFKAVT